ncbi:MAG: site-specific DNA-methyltransferase [Treponema sp.]|nr:site-specific DNA-methyltransferase [Treponema sp.]
MSTNISKQKRDALLDKITQIKNFISASPQDENTENLLAYIGELTKEINGKKYGLVFEEHREKIDELLEENAPVLVEDESLFIDNGGQMNFLIEGDNLAALKLLEKTHKGKIDVIYIDPPYNRGTKANKDFMYDDCYIDDTDEYKHSKWISFISKRLEIAKKLLTHDGIMFISIDEHEVENLKLLCNEIFYEKNTEFLIWRKNGKQGNTKKILRFKNTHEYIIACYMNREEKRLGKCKLFPNWKNDYPNPDNDPRGNYKAGNISLMEEKSDPQSPNYYTVTTPSGKQYTREWFISKEEFERLDNDKIENSDGILLGRIYYPNNGDGVPALKIFKSEEQYYYFDSIIDEMGTFTDAKDELVPLFNDRDAFDTPKPVKLIQEIIRISQPELQINKRKSSTILDFFAGSGTTGHAVMKLNAEDGGNRKFILCTNNQNNICRDITYERLRTVISGKRKDGSDYDESYPASLKYFKIDYLPIKDKMYYEYADELLEHVKELVELENAIDFNSNKSVTIVLDDDELDDFVENISDYPECKTLYMGHDVLTSYQQEQTIKAHGITINTVPDYYYRDLAN